MLKRIVNNGKSLGKWKFDIDILGLLGTVGTAPDFEHIVAKPFC